MFSLINQILINLRNLSKSQFCGAEFFAGFWLGSFQSFLGDLNENKSPLKPVLSKANMGPIFEVALVIHRSETGHILQLHSLNGGERHAKFPSGFPHRQTIIKQCQDFVAIDSLGTILRGCFDTFHHCWSTP